MPYEVLSFPHLNRHSLFLVFFALSVFNFCLQVNDYLSLYNQLFIGNFEWPFDAKAESPFFMPYSHSLAFASTGGMNASDLVNGSGGSEDDNGTEIILRGLLTDLGDKGRWKSLLDESLEKLDKNILTKIFLLSTRSCQRMILGKNFSD